MPRGNAPMAAALDHLVHRNDLAVLEDAQLVGHAVHLDNAPARGVRYAVEIAIHRDHAIAGDAPIEPQNRLERPRRERLELWLLFGKVRGNDTPGRGVRADVGHLVKPFAKLRIEIVEVAKPTAEEEVLAG
jgi:hypothetical protein